MDLVSVTYSAPGGTLEYYNEAILHGGKQGDYYCIVQSAYRGFLWSVQMRSLGRIEMGVALSKQQAWQMVANVIESEDGKELVTP